LAVDEEGICVGLGSSGDLEFWNRRTNERIWRCHAHDDGVYGVDMNSEIVASAGDDGLVKIFKRSHGDLLAQLDHHEYIVWTVKIWLNTLFTASYDCTVAHIAFNLTENNFEVTALNRIQGPNKWADAMGSDSTGQFIATHDENTFQLEIWDLHNKTNHRWDDPQFPTLCLSGHTDEVHCVKFATFEQSLLSGSADKTVRLWNLLNGDCLRILSGHEGNIWSLDMDQHRIVAGGRYGEVRIWGRQTKLEFCRSIWLHSRATAVGRIKLEPAVLITTDGLGGIVISDFWQFCNNACGCGKAIKDTT